MTNQIELSDTNMRSYVLMLLHDLPHDYKEIRLSELWDKSINPYKSGGQKNKSKIVGGVDWPTIMSVGVVGVSALASLVSYMGWNKNNDVLASDVAERLDTNLVIDNDDDDKLFEEQLINTAAVTLIEQAKTPKDKEFIERDKNKILKMIESPPRTTRSTIFRMQKLTELISILKIHILDALSEPSHNNKRHTLGGFKKRKVSSNSEPSIPELLESVSSSSDSLKETVSSTSKYLTPSSNEYLTPSSRSTQKNAKDGNTRTKKMSDNIALNEIFRNAFEIIFSGTKNNEIKEIITAFYTFYSMIKITPEISPLDVFDSSYVNSSLLIYLILKRSSINAEPKQIFDTVFSSDKGFKGGVSPTPEQNINLDIFKLYKDYYTGTKEIRKLKLSVISNTCKKIIDTFKKKGKGNRTIMEEYNIKSKTIDFQLKTIGIKETILNNTNVNPRREEYINNLKDTIKTLYLKIMFESILIPIKKKQKEIIMKVDYDENTPLKTIATKNPHKLVSALMNGVFKFSGIQRRTDVKLNTIFYNAEFSRLKGVAEGGGEYPAGETLDAQLLANFIEYAKRKAKVDTPETKDWNIIASTHPTYKNNNKPHIINNGVILSKLGANGIDSNNVTCTLSQRVDAMGNFGDCSNKTDVGKAEQKDKEKGLSYTTDIIITGESGEDYYISRMEETENREIIISYSLKLGNLVTPLFFKTIDNSEPRILDLSLTNTYKSVITRLLYIWAGDESAPSTVDNENSLNKLYNIITQKKETFIDLLLTSLQKGSGDSNQEINAFFINRGYISLPPNHTFKNPLLYVANDRPSAVRAMFVLINGSGDINENVSAGFPAPITKNRIYISRPPGMRKEALYGGRKMTRKHQTRKHQTRKHQTRKVKKNYF